MTTSVLNSVVVGIDGSPNSVGALHLAVSEALRRHSGLDIVYVAPPDASDAQVAGAYEMLAEIVAREFPEGVAVDIRYQVRCGDPAPMLLSESFGAPLLVLGGPAQAECSRLFGTRTVSRCLMHGRCSIEVSLDYDYDRHHGK